MKSSKGRGKPRPNQPADTNTPASDATRTHSTATTTSHSAAGPRQRLRLWTLCAVAVVGLALLIWQRANRDDPSRLLAEARELWTTDAVGADQRLQRAIAAAHGDFPEAQLLRCRLFIAQGVPADAVTYFEQIGRGVERDPEALLLLAEESRRAGELRLAAMSAGAVPGAAAQRSEALRILVQVESQTGQLDAAATHCREWIALAPASYEARRQLTRALRLQLQMLPAIEACRDALRLADANSADERGARRELVELLITVHDAEGARRAFDALAAGRRPGENLALVEAYLLRFEGRFAEALERADDELRERPRNDEARFLRGVLCFDLGRYAESADTLTQVVKGRASHKEAHYKLAQALQRLERAAEAQTHLDISAHLTRLAEERLQLHERLGREPGNPEILARLAAVCRELGREDEAVYWQRAAGQAIKLN